MSRSLECDVIPLALLRAHLRRKELLDEAKRKEKRPRLAFIFSGFQKRWFRTEPSGLGTP